MEEQLQPFTQNDYEIARREVLYQGFYRLVRNHIRHMKFDGTWTGEFARELVERPSAVAVLPYDPVLEHVVLIEQFRSGAIANPQSPWLIETIAGLYKPGDNLADVTHREAQEEAGIELLDIYKICEYFVSPGGSDEYLTLYCGRVNASNAGGIYGLAEENEDIRAFALPLDEAFTLLQEGKIKTSPAIIALQWLQLNRVWLRQLWQIK